MAEIVKDLGVATAYGYAKANGYTGTEEEFGVLMASYATVADEAAASAAAASASADDSADSAAEAAQKVLDAAAQVALATEQAEAAASSATEASGYATDASGSATDAETYKTQAQGFSQDAGADAALALGYKNAAQTYAGDASTSAGNAADSATAASTSATNASTSATNAANSATAAAASATSAAESAAHLVIDDELSTESENAVQNKLITSALETKAEVDGAYEQMTVGNAEQLVSNVGIEDSVPYNFRTSGGSADIGDREVDKIVGGTIAWNQLCDISTIANGTVSGITYTNNHDGTFTLSGTQTSQALNIWALGGYNRQEELFRITANHVYLLSEIRPFGFNDTNEYTTFINTTYLGKGLTIKKPNKSGKVTGIRIADTDGFDGTVTNYKMPIVFFDLTEMFGSTIADYIYSLEQSTAGAGVAWFRKLFPRPYYAYNAGELMSVQTSAHKMVGFNAVDVNDPNNTSAYIDNTGAIMTNANWTTSGKVRVVSGSPYTLEGLTSHPNSSTDNYRLYDAAENYIGLVAKAIQSYPITFGAEVAYVQFCWKTEEKDSVCFHLVWDGERDGEYEEYKQWVYPLDSDLVLRGIPKLSSGNDLYYDGDTYESDGTVTRKYGVVNLDSDTINKGGTTGGGLTVYEFTGKPTCVAGGNAISNYGLPVVSGVTAWTSTADVISLQGNGNVRISSAETSLESLRQKYSGMVIVYELATPTTESADPYQNPQIVEDFGTEEYVDERTVAIPVGHETFYQANLKAKLEMAPNSPDGDGDYVVRQTNGKNEYVPLLLPASDIPAAPSEDGTYTLTVTISNGTATYSWAANS